MASILIIEDDNEFRETLCAMLEADGHEVKQAENGELGYKVFSESPTELVITDLMMPKKDGIMLIQEMLAQFPRARIVAMSGAATGNPAWLPIAKSAGAIRILRKPFPRDTLLEVIKEALANPWV